VTGNDLSAIVIECVARTERASASTEESVARGERVHLNLQLTRLGLEVVRLKQEDAIARQEVLTARLEQQWADADARWQEERVAMRESGERQEKMLQEYARQTDQIVAELKGARDERRAMLAALCKLMDEPPPFP